MKGRGRARDFTCTYIALSPRRIADSRALLQAYSRELGRPSCSASKGDVSTCSSDMEKRMLELTGDELMNITEVVIFSKAAYLSFCYIGEEDSINICFIRNYPPE